MRKRLLSFCTAVLMCATLLIPTAFAVDATPRASDQITAYSTEVKAFSNAKIGMNFAIEGTGWMDCLGAEEITVYEQLSNGGWMIVAYYDRNDTNMSKKSANRYGNTIYYTGTKGCYYKVVMTVFAEDASGYDSRTKTHYVTAI